MLRMTRAPFFVLCNLFRHRGLVPETEGCTVEEQVAMFLHVVGHNQRFRVVHQSFRRSIEIVHRPFHQVLYAVDELRNEMIKPPSARSIGACLMGWPNSLAAPLGCSAHV